MVRLVSRGLTTHSCLPISLNFLEDVTLFTYLKETLVLLKAYFPSPKSLCRQREVVLLRQEMYLLKRRLYKLSPG